MEQGDNVPDALFEDVKMMDLEDREIVGQDLNTESSERTEITDVKTVRMEYHNDNPGRSNNRRRRKNKQRKRGSLGKNVSDVNRYPF